MALYLTFDLGTTALKTALLDGDGHLLALHTVEYTAASPRPDWAEMEPEIYWQAAVAGARAVFEAAELRSGQIGALGFSSQGQTFVPLDASDRPLHRAIVWVDKRAAALAEEWCQTWFSPEEYRRLTGYPRVPPELTLFKIAWLARHRPDAHAARRFLCLPDYLIRRLTGECATDYNLAQMTGMYDVETRAWAPQLLDAGGITADQLPPVHAPGTVVGTVLPCAAQELGIPPGVPVAVGANDQLAGALGAGNVRPGIVSETTGTALAAIATTASRLDDPRMYAGRHAVAGLWYAMPFANSSAIVLKWFRDLCASGEDYDAFLSAVGEVPPGCEGLSVLPHFAGAGSPTFNPRARGALVGLTLGHTRAHIARAIMESCACLLREVLEPLADHGLRLASVRSLGGAARSDLWLQMKADLLGLPVERPACPDAASLGAAMLAATGTRQFASVADAAAAWYRPDRVFEPEPALLDAYAAVYGRYLELYDRLYAGG